MTDRLTSIFHAQMKLLVQFHLIERNNGFRIQSMVPADLDDKHDQLRIKELAWRVTEEIAEAIQELDSGGPKYHEEISDVIHFLVELMIVSGLTPESDPEFTLEQAYLKADRDPPIERTLVECWFNVVVQLGLSMNQLKNRPWKEKHRPTDRSLFYRHLQSAFYQLVFVCRESDVKTPDQFHQLYFRKNAINQQRQRDRL